MRKVRGELNVRGSLNFVLVMFCKFAFFELFFGLFWILNEEIDLDNLGVEEFGLRINVK